MKNFQITLTMFLLVAFFFSVAAFAADASPKPNIVVILSDDYGWGSLGCYDAPAELKTPNLDR